MIIFETKDYCFSRIEYSDVDDIISIYNSNKKFLNVHLNISNVTNEWYIRELNEMKKANFTSCKIIDKRCNKIIGFIDFKVGLESYLSILMIDSSYKHKGIGTKVYNCFEDYIREYGSKKVRIDVVTGYDEGVYDFWRDKGFKKFKTISLQWDENRHIAEVMIKDIRKKQNVS